MVGGKGGWEYSHRVGSDMKRHVEEFRWEMILKDKYLVKGIV